MLFLDHLERSVGIDELLPQGRARAGFLLHQKFVNFPLQLIGHLHQNLKDDIFWARDHPDTTESSHSLSTSGRQDPDAAPTIAWKDITSLVLMSPCEFVTGRKRTKGSAANANEVVVEFNKGTMKDEVVFDCFEDEIFHEESRRPQYIVKSSLLRKPVMVTAISPSEYEKGVSALEKLTA
jgi:hypothetical protein